VDTEPARPRWGVDRRSAYEQDRIWAIRWEAMVRRVECPRCGAGLGEDCHSAAWWPTSPHVGRVRAAEAAE
jgi:hypothetical protein